jgi:membrane-associated phospholipid phosphatase
MFYDLQIKMIHQIQSISSPTLDAVFKFLNYFDSIYFYLFLILIIWAGYKEKWGIKLCYLLFFSFLANDFLKNFFQEPRPYFLDPSVAKAYVSYYGLPSGGAMTSLFLSIILIASWRTKWAWILGICYAALISFSRVYLGVHFPTDVVGGWIVGILLAWGFLKYTPKIEDKIEQMSDMKVYWISQAIGALFYFTMQGIWGLFFTGAAMGLGAGFYFSTKVKIPEVILSSWIKRLISIFLAIGGVLALLLPIEIYKKSFSYSLLAVIGFLEYYVMGIWMMFLFPYLRSKIFKFLK